MGTPTDPTTISGSRDTPAMKQYYRFKALYPDCVLFFRMGDFYELFDEDAILVSKAIGLTLTQRTSGIPMAGMPYHAVDGYAQRLMREGHKIAICDQIEDPKEAKGVVERAVTRVLTPGAVVDETLLDEDRANRMAAISFAGSGEDSPAAIAVADVSTGEFVVFEARAGEAADALLRYAPTELLFAETEDGKVPARVAVALEACGAAATPRPVWNFRPQESAEVVQSHYGVRTLAGFGLEQGDPCVAAAGALLRRLLETQAPEGAPRAHAGGANALAHLSPPRKLVEGETLGLDAASIRSLEIERTMRGENEEGTLVGVFLRAGQAAPRTAMGKRLVRDWLRRPLARREAIEARHGQVETLVSDQRMLGELRKALDEVQDAARIAARCAIGRAGPRDLVALARSLAKAGAIRDAIRGAPAFAGLLARFESVKETLGPLGERIGATLVDSPPANVRDGGAVREGVDAELDEARGLETDASAWLASYQAELSRTHSLPGIKVGFNKVFGYYIELPAAQARRAPEGFTRKQTLKNAERYTTPQLSEFEGKVTTARERALARELSIFEALCGATARLSKEIVSFAEACAEADALSCFASVAERRGWVRPRMSDLPVLEIEQGRHPVLEGTLGNEFVPNDVVLGSAEAPARLALITGPNMAGKSTFIRQVALLALLAHAGSFVPAAKAEIGVADRVFTRVGADDALHAGQSTFMVEMTETANILHHATERSIVVLDEVGRGTSTLDGLALAWAIAERLGGEGGPAARSLFATHYHELTQLEEALPGRVKNLHVAVREWKGGIVFVHRILAGRTNKSYGVHVARLAGLPSEVVARAKELLERLSVSHEPSDVRRIAGDRAGRDDGSQMKLFGDTPHPAVEALKELELEEMTPLKAFDELRKLKGMVEE